jgi:hypothetical protein
MDIEEEVIYHLSQNVKTEIRPSKVDGVGVFAIRDILKGENVFPEWQLKSGIYLVSNEKLNKIPSEVLNLLDKYFINGECGFKIIRLFDGLNFMFNPFCFCNSAYPNKENVNISTKGIALRYIKKDEEIFEWYDENILK